VSSSEAPLSGLVLLSSSYSSLLPSLLCGNALPPLHHNPLGSPTSTFPPSAYTAASSLHQIHLLQQPAVIGNLLFTAAPLLHPSQDEVHKGCLGQTAGKESHLIQPQLSQLQQSTVNKLLWGSAVQQGSLINVLMSSATLNLPTSAAAATSEDRTILVPPSQHLNNANLCSPQTPPSSREYHIRNKLHALRQLKRTSRGLKLR
jgi:hypothetical protein